MGIASDVGRIIKARLSLKTIASEVLATVIGRVSHGASEVAHGLFTQGPAYVPYGQDTMPVSAADERVQAAQAELEATAAAPSPLEQYQTNLSLYAQRSAPAKDQTPSL